MFSTLFSVALFAAAAIRGVSAAFAVNSPQIVQCQSVKISWAPTAGPYNVILAPGSDMCGDPLVDLGDFDTTLTHWTAALPAGTTLYISVMDANEQEAWSNLITVQPSSDSSCLKSAASPPASSPSPSPTPSVVPLGAANAGVLGSSAITAHRASLPVLAFAGLAVVVALLQ